MMGENLTQRLMVGLVVSCLHLTVNAAEQVIEEIIVTATKRGR